jgi:hypothetical protein
MNVNQIIFKLFDVAASTAEVKILGFLSGMFSDYGLLGLIQCSLISEYQHFRGRWFLHLQGSALKMEAVYSSKMLVIH